MIGVVLVINPKLLTDIPNLIYDYFNSSPMKEGDEFTKEVAGGINYLFVIGLFCG